MSYYKGRLYFNFKTIGEKNHVLANDNYTYTYEQQCLYVCVCKHVTRLIKLIKLNSLTYLSPLKIIFLWHEYLKSTSLAISKSKLHHFEYDRLSMK